MNWFFYSILALASFVAYDLYSRKLGVNSINPRAFSVIFNGAVVILTPLLLLIEPLSLNPLPIKILLITIINLLSWTLFGRFEYFAHKFVEASTLSIILRLAPALTFIFSIIFLHEQ